MRKKQIIYLVTWFCLLVIFLFSSEPIIRLLMPGTHNVGAWLILLFIGIIFITVVMAILFIIDAIKHRKR